MDYNISQLHRSCGKFVKQVLTDKKAITFTKNGKPAITLAHVENPKPDKKK
jgi:PHD/YefM family antitoxin component YafN of YafNO toxin-antitoxin module